ncbi:MAG: hypothetical protein ABSA03_13725, partial [Streptosporangiaceae bacterium]
AADQIKLSGRQTMGVRLMNLAEGQSLVAIARNAESGVGDAADDGSADDGSGDDGSGVDGSGEDAAAVDGTAAVTPAEAAAETGPEAAAGDVPGAADPHSAETGPGARQDDDD